MEQGKKTKLIITMSFLVMTFIIGVTGVSYAYYRARVAKTNESTLIVGAANLDLLYTESMNITSDGQGSNIAPGWTGTKTFTIRNNGTAAATYKISWTGVSNSFVNKGYLTYNITGTNNGCNVNIATFPSATEQICTATIAAGESQVYTLNVQYRDSSTYNLASDMGKAFAGTITVEGLSMSDTYTVAVAATNATIAGGTTLTNEVINSSFNTDLSNWNLRGMLSTLINTGGINNSPYIRINPTGTYNFIASNQISILQNEKAYVTGYYKKWGGGATRVMLYDDDSGNKLSLQSNNTFTDSSDWAKLSFIATNTSSTISIFRCLLYGSSTSYVAGMYSEWDNIQVINLSDISWQTKTQAWLDKNVPFFEGTGSVKSNTASAGGTVTFNLTPGSSKVYNELVCDGGYRTASVTNNVLTVTGVSSDIQCSVFYR